MTTDTINTVDKAKIKRVTKKSFEEKLKDVNEGWEILNELGDNKFKIPTRNKDIQLNQAEKNIIASSKNDAEAIKIHDDSANSDFISMGNETRSIRKKVISDELITPNSGNKSLSTEIISNELAVNLSTDAIRNKSISEKNKNSENVLKNKNLFFRFFMKGIAQIYVDKTTSIFNPVMFVLKNLRSLIQTALLFGVPAIITWYLFNEVTSLKTLFSSVSVISYWFYAAMFYTATLFFCLTSQILLSGIWVILRKSMSEVAIKASANSKI